MAGGRRPRALRVQSVLYGNHPRHVDLAARHLERTADFAIARGLIGSLRLIYGDCSPSPVLDELGLQRLRQIGPGLGSVEYRYFDGNLGSARGHNHLLADLSEDLVLILNPDVLLAPDALVELLRAVDGHRVGMVEARQLPIEHPKEYDPVTGETSWAATACALIPAQVIRDVGTFDAESFFLYCDDVDFSWRVRRAGRKVIYQPSAAVFHDKRLSDEGRWKAGGAEQYYSAEAALMLAHKWSRPDLVSRILADFRSSGAPHLRRAVHEYERRSAEGRLPQPIDPEHKVGVFENGYYARHRFAL